MSYFRLFRAALAGALAIIAWPAQAAVEIQWWHAMPGELGHQLEKIANDFNASQPDYRVVPVFKGNYADTVMAAIFAFRSNTQPAIVQVNEIATATMMAAKGAIYPVYELMRDQGEQFDPTAYLPAVTGYYTDVSGNMLSFPFNASTPILYYNKQLFQKAGLDTETPPKTYPELEAAAGKLRAAGVPCGFTTHWPSWVNIENFSALHNLPIATKANGFAGLDARLTINNPSLSAISASSPNGKRPSCSITAAAPPAPSRASSAANAASFSDRRRRAPTSSPRRSSASATAGCRTGLTFPARRKTPSSAAPRCGC